MAALAINNKSLINSSIEKGSMALDSDVKNGNVITDPKAKVKSIKDMPHVVQGVAKHLVANEPSPLSPPNEAEQDVLGKLYLSSGKKKMYSAFFSIDLRGFTPLSHEKSPEELSFLISHFSTSIARLTEACGGNVLKYVGDAVLAFFPTVKLSTSVERAYLLAISTALFMNKHFLPYAKDRDIKTAYGMGIDAGEVGIVKLGSPSLKLSYDLIGKPINVAVKLQAMAKSGELIVSELAYNLAPSWIQERAVEFKDYDKHPSGVKRSFLEGFLFWRRPVEKLYKVKLPDEYVTL